MTLGIFAGIVGAVVIGNILSEMILEFLFPLPPYIKRDDDDWER